MPHSQEGVHVSPCWLAPACCLQGSKPTKGKGSAHPSAGWEKGSACPASLSMPSARLKTSEKAVPALVQTGRRTVSSSQPKHAICKAQNWGEGQCLPSLQSTHSGADWEKKCSSLPASKTREKGSAGFGADWEKGSACPTGPSMPAARLKTGRKAVPALGQTGRRAVPTQMTTAHQMRS